ncbi:hypothetical protein [Streptomyces sp. 35G-GA-8]|uniref:hypothetical protein n=1 Tax=Streptomyces sp. 35G-GA-8 TaxID=2939434 RepID=UPI00201EAEEA|nr:hypothetical protein [Streptomyces sp. 35G-GA-8]MCL7377482.1 hypothetical protein [Streptomyces sp. 35G-GA-8]
MTRKKTTRVRIEVLTSFNGMVAGDTGAVDLNGRVQGWINAGLVKVVDAGGTNQVGPGGAEPNDPWSEPQGAGDGGPAASESGERAGPG